MRQLNKQLTRGASDITSVTEKIIKSKLGVLELAEEPCNVSKACKIIGRSRNSFYDKRGKDPQQSVTTIKIDPKALCFNCRSIFLGFGKK